MEREQISLVLLPKADASGDTADFKKTTGDNVQLHMSWSVMGTINLSVLKR